MRFKSAIHESSLPRRTGTSLDRLYLLIAIALSHHLAFVVLGGPNVDSMELGSVQSRNDAEQLRSTRHLSVAQPC